MPAKLSAAALGALAILPSAAWSQAFRIGTYDSRAIAVAYAHSDMLREWHTKLRAQREEAMKAGDEQRAREIEARGKAAQERLHQQGFSTGSVMSLFERIRQEIPAVARDARVVLIVSKWEVVHRDPSIEYVDVTMPLVMKFRPSAQVLKTVEGVLKNDPIPLDKLPSHAH
jgi:hypothetical protein